MSTLRDTPPWPRHGTPSPAPCGVAPLLALILFLLLPPHPCPAALLRSGIALWEDSADPLTFVREGHGRALDDHLTVSLAAWAEWTQGTRPLGVRLEHHVITEKDRGRRVDLAFALLETSHALGPARLELGLGPGALGRLGGAGLQNAYHRLGGVATVDLDYPDHTRWAPVASQHLVLSLGSERPLAPALELHNLDHGSGFHRLRVLASGTLRNTAGWALDGFAGITGYHHLDQRLGSSFRGGPCWGLALGGPVGSRWHLDLWLLARTRRPDQSSPGLALAWHHPRSTRSSWSRRLGP